MSVSFAVFLFFVDFLVHGYPSFHSKPEMKSRDRAQERSKDNFKQSSAQGHGSSGEEAQTLRVGKQSKHSCGCTDLLARARAHIHTHVVCICMWVGVCAFWPKRVHGGGWMTCVGVWEGLNEHSQWRRTERSRELCVRQSFPTLICCDPLQWHKDSPLFLCMHLFPLNIHCISEFSFWELLSDHHHSKRSYMCVYYSQLWLCRIHSLSDKSRNTPLTGRQSIAGRTHIWAI